jgi:hypothetical protein
MRLLGDGLYGSCLYGGTDLVPCTRPSTVVAPCPEQVPDASSPDERVLTSICPEGDC